MKPTDTLQLALKYGEFIESPWFAHKYILPYSLLSCQNRIIYMECFVTFIHYSLGGLLHIPFPIKSIHYLLSKEIPFDFYSQRTEGRIWISLTSRRKSVKSFALS